MGLRTYNLSALHPLHKCLALWTPNWIKVGSTCLFVLILSCMVINNVLDFTLPSSEIGVHSLWNEKGSHVANSHVHSCFPLGIGPESREPFIDVSWLSQDPIIFLGKRLECLLHAQVKLSKKFPLHVWIYNIPLRKEDGSYTFSLRVIGVRSLLLVRSRCKNPPPLRPCDLCRFMLMTFTSFYNG
jgi:hypothetical protein